MALSRPYRTCRQFRLRDHLCESWSTAPRRYEGRVLAHQVGLDEGTAPHESLRDTFYGNSRQEVIRKIRVALAEASKALIVKEA